MPKGNYQTENIVEVFSEYHGGQEVYSEAKKELNNLLTNIANLEILLDKLNGRIQQLPVKFPEVFSKVPASALACSPGKILDVVEEYIENKTLKEGG